MLLALCRRELREASREIAVWDEAVRLAEDIPEIRLARAAALLGAGRHEAAAADCLAILREEPGHGDAQILLAETALARSPPNLPTALAALDEAERWPGTARTARRLRARVHLTAGDTERAREVLAACLSDAGSEEEDVLAVTDLATVEDAAAGRIGSPAARHLCEDLLQRRPRCAPAIEACARLLLRAGDIDTARAILDRDVETPARGVSWWRLVFDASLAPGAGAPVDLPSGEAAADRLAALSPEGPDSIYARGTRALLAGELDPAAELLERAAELAPRDAVIACRLALARRARGDALGAVRALESALLAEPGLRAARLFLLRATHEAGIDCMERGSDLAAMEHFAQVMEAHPGSLAARTGYTVAGLRAAGDRPEVLQAVEAEAQDLVRRRREASTGGADVELARACILLGEARRLRGDLVGYVVACEEHIAALPGDPLGLMRLGLALLSVGRHAEAIERLEAARAALPEGREPVVWLAAALRAGGRPADALALVRHWRDRHPEDPVVHLVLGLFEEAEDPSAAAESYARVVSLAPEADFAAERLAHLLAALGRGREAEEVLRSLLPGARCRGDLLLVLAEVRAAPPEQVVRSAEEAWNAKIRSRVRRLRCVRLGLEAVEGLGDRNAARLWAGRLYGEVDRLADADLAAALLFRAGQVFDRLEEDAWAETAYRRALLRAADHVPSLNNLAYLLAVRGGASRESLRLAERAAELAPEAAEVWDTLGIARFHSGDLPAAVLAFHRAIDLFDARDEPPVRERELSRVRMARALALTGRAKESRDALTSAKSALPEIVRELEYAEAEGLLR